MKYTALWEKLSEIERKLDKLSTTQKLQVQKQEEPAGQEEQKEDTPDLKETKVEIIAEIKRQAYLLGRHNDSNYAANKQNNELLDKHILMATKKVDGIREQLKICTESKKEDKESHFNFKFFKVRKTSFVIAALGLLVFVLTLFCMKQQNDYALLLNEYYNQYMTAEQIKNDADSLKTSRKKPTIPYCCVKSQMTDKVF